MGKIALAIIFAACAGFGPADAKSTDMSRVPKAKSGWTRLAATTCFKSGEQTSGMNKICYYNCLGSQAAITIGAVELCPLTIER